MIARKPFSKSVLETIQKEKIFGIRAGKDPAHRVIGIWAVVVKGRVFVRSWSLKPRSWWRAFLEDPQGTFTAGKTEIQIRAVQTRSETLKDAVSEAYRQKYNKPGEIQYVRDMSRKKSRDTTTELVPLQ
jgi:hypothetical protein